MKLFKLTFIIILVFCSISSALCLSDLGVSVGLTNSIHNFNTIYLIGARWEIGHKLGYNVGFFVDIFKHHNLFSRLSTSFVQKGANINIVPVIPDPTPRTYHNHLNYVSFAFLEGIEISTNYVKPYFIFGGRYDILILKNIEKLNSFYDSFESNVFGLTGGIGLKFKGFNFPFFTEIIYDYDITNSKAQSSVSEDFQKIKNKSINFKIGIEF